MTGFLVAVGCLVSLALITLVMEWRSRIKDWRVTGLCPHCREQLSSEGANRLHCRHCGWNELRI